MGKHCDGLLLIDKSEGETSFSVVRKIREATKIRKVGHAGTLDPFATGLLVLLLGQGTKLSPYLMAGRKRYHATLRLGLETDTLDPTGNIVNSRPVPVLDKVTIQRTVERFIGDIEQRPPQFSAVKFEGKRAYRLARKGVEIPLHKRRVTIHLIHVLSVDLPEMVLDIICSKGTYIRSLAADLGVALGTVAYLKALRRLESEPFHVKGALPAREVRGDTFNEICGDRIMTLPDALPHIPTIHVDADMARRVRQGYRPVRGDLVIPPKCQTDHDGWLKMVWESQLVALAAMERSSKEKVRHLKLLRVFHEARECH